MCKGKELPQNINLRSFNVEDLKPNLEVPNFWSLSKIKIFPSLAKHGKQTPLS